MSGTYLSSNDFAIAQADALGATTTETNNTYTNAFATANDATALAVASANVFATAAAAVIVILDSGSTVGIQTLMSQASVATGVASANTSGGGFGNTSGHAVEAAATDNSANPTSDTNGYGLA